MLYRPKCFGVLFLCFNVELKQIIVYILFVYNYVRCIINANLDSSFVWLLL